jgi:hypothetical protein
MSTLFMVVVLPGAKEILENMLPIKQVWGGEGRGGERWGS